MNDIVVISGPSGCGKSTLIARLLEGEPGLRFSVSHTTRPRRENETDGVDYHFVDRERFEEMITEQAFAEWAVVHGHLYGTSWAEIREKTSAASAGQALVLDVDTQGARAIKARFPESLMIFILPPSLAELRRRLLGREGGEDANVSERLTAAIGEMKQYELYDFALVNDRLDEAATALRCIVRSRRYILPRQKELIENMLRGVT